MSRETRARAALEEALYHFADALAAHDPGLSTTREHLDDMVHDVGLALEHWAQREGVELW